MCGIWLYLGSDKPLTAAAAAALEARGPEGSKELVFGGGVALFTRLAINGLSDSGMQPMSSGKIHWLCNGEIYNWRALAATYGIDATSGSDCEIIGPLYKRFKAEGLGEAELFRALDGVFSCVIIDEESQEVIVGRDPYGVRPLYIGSGKAGIFLASELKALEPYGPFRYEPFAPGTFSVYKGGRMRRAGTYHTIPFLKFPALGDAMYKGLVREALKEAVKKRMLADRPVAALVSGGIDSSLVAALVAEQLRGAGAPPLHTFSIGFTGSKDLEYARKVACWIGSQHHEIVMTPADFFAAIPMVIRAIESFDTTTVRASVGNYLVAKAVREQTDCKVVFNGDGSDEVFGSYLYFYGAPSDAAFEAESERLLEEIHYYDVLRSDRSISSNGLEARTPFLDKQFVAVARAAPTELRRPRAGVKGEKELLRAAFRDTSVLPHDVLERRKEAFSDGVSGGGDPWYVLAQKEAEKLVPADWRVRAGAFAEPRPTTAEQFYYRSIYEAAFPGVGPVNVPAFWMPRWCSATDPSARTLAVYAAGATAGQN